MPSAKLLPDLLRQCGQMLSMTRMNFFATDLSTSQEAPQHRMTPQKMFRLSLWTRKLAWMKLISKARTLR